MNDTECIANPGHDGATEVPYFDCPCRACWRMERDALDDSTEPPTYTEWAAERTPA